MRAKHIRAPAFAAVCRDKRRRAKAGMSSRRCRCGSLLRSLRFVHYGLPMDIRNIVVLTGAGVSAESGLATFRGPDGLWEGHRVEDVATPEAFHRDPALVL